MDRLAEGKLPNGEDAYVDEAGRQWGGILLFAQSDLEQLCLQWGLPSYNDIDEMCPYCRANRSSRPFTNLQEDAEWRPTASLSNQDIPDELMVS